MAYSHSNLGLGNNMGYGLAFGLYNPFASAENSNQILALQKQIQSMQRQPQAPVQQSMNPVGPNAFQNKLNRLTINASDALYGGLLGYNPKPITSPTGNVYNPPNPQGGFRFPFGLLNGGQ